MQKPFWAMSPEEREAARRQILIDETELACELLADEDEPEPLTHSATA